MTERIDDEAALEEVMTFLDNPPEPGGADDARFGERLRQVIAASIPLDEGDDPEDGPTLRLDDDFRGRLDKALDQAKQQDWTIVDMASQWRRIYPFEASANEQQQ